MSVENRHLERGEEKRKKRVFFFKPPHTAVMEVIQVGDDPSSSNFVSVTGLLPKKKFRTASCSGCYDFLGNQELHTSAISDFGGRRNRRNRRRSESVKHSQCFSSRAAPKFQETAFFKLRSHGDRAEERRKRWKSRQLEMDPKFSDVAPQSLPVFNPCSHDDLWEEGDGN